MFTIILVEVGGEKKSDNTIILATALNVFTTEQIPEGINAKLCSICQRYKMQGIHNYLFEFC